MAAGIQLPGSGETIELQQQVARLQALLEASRQVHSTIHENEVLEQTLRIVVRELEMAGAAFPDVGLAYGNVKDLNLCDGGGSAMPIYLLQDREGNRMAELVVAPPDGRDLTIYEADFLEGLTLQTAVALENARNHERNLQWARMQQDLDAARNIQRSLLPQTLPNIPGYSVGFNSVTCYEVGGDYLDIVEQPDGSLLMLVADVAGKGMASAIMATSFRSAFRAIALTGLPLDELAERMNQHHWTEGEEARRRYVTAIFLRLYPEKGELEVVNAGHNPGFLLQPGSRAVELESTGTPLGLLPGMRYTCQKCAFTPGTQLLFYTDGLTEAFCGEEEFGPERLMDVFSACRSGNADDILGALWTAIGEFSQGTPQGDDMTALALCRKREAECATETNA
ncbi:MAG TPA: PP2C family protein-serine/threonine phosphatase [Terracidiphilus sp.]|jgi:serine phosphatase RsbU (regulator of sigma subunit)|nr:PP2C family protein-serine/threonine phosphatase [Terracidiphilus sp.]